MNTCLFLFLYVLAAALSLLIVGAWPSSGTKTLLIRRPQTPLQSLTCLFVNVLRVSDKADALSFLNSPLPGSFCCPWVIVKCICLRWRTKGREQRSTETVKSRKRKKKKNGRKFWRLIKMYAGTRGAEAAAENPLKTRHCKTKQKKALTVQQHADKQEREAEKR